VATKATNRQLVEALAKTVGDDLKKAELRMDRIDSVASQTRQIARRADELLEKRIDALASWLALPWWKRLRRYNPLVYRSCDTLRSDERSKSNGHLVPEEPEECDGDGTVVRMPATGAGGGHA